jgi:hypothetical protein
MVVVGERSMRGIGVGLSGALLLAMTGSAAAAEGPAPVSLSCEGTLVTRVESEARLSARLDEFQTAQAAIAGPRSRAVRVAARMDLRIEGDVVTVRPQTAPDRRSADGWFALSGVTVDGERIAGVAPYRDADAMKPRLVLDRRSGAMRFGSFSGRCEAV